MTDQQQEALDRLRRCLQAQDELRAKYRDAVGFAREQGLSWAAIGEAMGMSKQAVHSYARRQDISDPR